MWEDFREEYSTIQLAMLRETSASDTESGLDIAERILKLQMLADVANADALHMLESWLLAGVEKTKVIRCVGATSFFLYS